MKLIAFESFIQIFDMADTYFLKSMIFWEILNRYNCISRWHQNFFLNSKKLNQKIYLHFQFALKFRKLTNVIHIDLLLPPMKSPASFFH